MRTMEVLVIFPPYELQLLSVESFCGFFFVVTAIFQQDSGIHAENCLKIENCVHFALAVESESSFIKPCSGKVTMMSVARKR